MPMAGVSPAGANGVRGNLNAMERSGERSESAVGSLAPSEATPELDDGAGDAGLWRVFNQSVMRERILAAAITIVANQGFAACSVREVAEAVGIRAPGLYSHFPSKEAILSEAVSRVLADFMENAVVVPSSSPEQELKDTVRQHVRYQIDNLQLARVTDVVLNTASAGGVLAPDDYGRLLSKQRDHIGVVEQRVAAYSPELPAEQIVVATRAIISMCDGVATWYRPGGNLDVYALADLHWRFVRRMLG